MRVTSMLAEFIGKSRFEDCPPAAVDAARRAITDCLGVMLAGSTEPAARIVQTVAQAEGGTPLCTIVGTGRRTGGVWAALANGTAAHALDFDDTNFAMMGHPSAPVLAAALAAGELGLATGQDLVHAFLLGFEVETTLAEVINPAHYEHGWHATCTLGTLGAAAAASRLLGLDIAQTATALAVAASQASGLKENFGTMTKPFHAGHAARSGVLAALLAREGWTASEQAIEGPQGYLHAFSAGRREPGALMTLGAPWKITTTGVAVKPYPSCACTHSIIDGALELRRTHGLRPSQIASVVIGVNHAVPNILIHSDPKSGLEAKFSGEFSAAAALDRRPGGHRDVQRRQGARPRSARAHGPRHDGRGPRDPGRARAAHVDPRHHPPRRRPHAVDRSAAGARPPGPSPEGRRARGEVRRVRRPRAPRRSRRRPCGDAEAPRRVPRPPKPHGRSRSLTTEIRSIKETLT